MNDSRANILEILEKRHITPVIIQHPPVFTCEEADAYTPDPAAGLKSLVLETASKLHIACVVLGNQRVDFKALQVLVGERVHMMPEELACNFVGCDKGAIPPFGHSQAMPIYADNELLKHSILYFNPGKNTETMGIEKDDFVNIFSEYGAVFSQITKV